MKYCENCGVELDQSMDECPLCHKPATGNKGQTESQQPHSTSFPAPKKNIPPKNDREKKQNRKLFWELTVLIFFSVAIITLLIDLFTSHQFSWSKYSVGISLVLIINSSLFSFLRHKPIILIGGSFTSIAILLLLLDYFEKSTGWGLMLGIPLLLLLYLFILCIILLIKYLKEKGINFIALILSAASIICLVVEILLDNYMYHQIAIGWSMYVVLSALPVAGILLFVHYRMKKGRELNRLFHV